METFFKNALAITLETKNGQKNCSVIYAVSPVLKYVWRWKHQIRSALFECTVTGWYYRNLSWRSMWAVNTKWFWSSNAKAIHHSRIWRTQTVAHLWNKLFQLLKSDTVSKDSSVDYIDIPMLNSVVSKVLSPKTQKIYSQSRRFRVSFKFFYIFWLEYNFLQWLLSKLLSMQLAFHLTCEWYEMCTTVIALELDCTLHDIFCFHSKILDAKMLF